VKRTKASLDERLVAASQRRRRRTPGFVAIGRSGQSDTAERQEELLFRRQIGRRGRATR
jgi:hypothetical protein